MKEGRFKNNPYNFVMEDGCIKAAIGIYNPLTSFNGSVYGGTCVKVFEMIMDKLGLCYKYVPSPNGLWGTEYPNGTWDGLVGLAQRNDVEIIVCPVATTHRRFQVVDFAKTVTNTFYHILYPRPSVKANVFGFVQPFSTNSWFLIGGTVLALYLLSLLLNKTVLTQSNNADSAKSWNTKLYNEIWFKGPVNQPITKFPQHNAGRVLMATWLLISFILSVVFKSNLKALLIVPKVEVPFDTLEELVEQNTYSWSFLKGSIIPQYFKPAYEEDPNSVMGKGWSRRGELYTSADQILPFVLERKMACISLSYKVLPLLSDDFSETGRCRMAVAREKLLNLDITFALRKGSNLTSFIDPIIMNMNEFGLLNQIFSEGNANATYCNVPPGQEIGLKLRSLTIEDFLGIFSILGSGFLLAAIVLVGEIFMKKMQN